MKRDMTRINATLNINMAFNKEQWRAIKEVTKDLNDPLYEAKEEQKKIFDTSRVSSFKEKYYLLLKKKLTTDKIGIFFLLFIYFLFYFHYFITYHESHFIR